MRILQYFFVCFIFSFYVGFSQQKPSPPKLIQQALENKKDVTENSIVKNLAFENIGPTVMSGRVVDLDVNPSDPTEFYVAYASGGVWHTSNNGSAFTPILDSSATQNVGDIAVDWKTNTIWVGTGENNASRSSYAGIGILKSSNHGKTWDHVGLLDSHHIGRILINPNNPDEVIVGVTGHLYSSNKNRGIYKTTNGGKTWQHTLFIDEISGVIDVQHVPNNFNIMFASSWTKDRKAWNFTGSGNNSAIYKSTDGGSTWTKISTPASGFPTGDGVGRIGLAVFSENIIYALHDNQFRRSKEKSESPQQDLTKEDFKTMSATAFLKLDDKTLNEFLKTNGFQEKYRAENVKQLVRSGHIKPIDLAKYLENANTLLFDTPVVGAEVYKSLDGGETWQKTHDNYIEDLYYSYGYYFGEIRVDPQNESAIYIMGVPILKSKDAGKTFSSINKENVHVDHHALWINPEKTGHLINGNDGGVNISYDDGESWEKLNVTAVGQFYAINVDNETPYNVYGGLQDNGVWVGAHNAVMDKRWQQTGHNPWESIMGGDGMHIQIDNRDVNTVYTGYQFGNYFRINRANHSRKYIQPKHKLGERPYRFNWQTPILLSIHNQDILYLGANKLMRSMNQGDDWTAISNDLTQGEKQGNVAYGTLTSISESPFQFGLIYTGSDDGLIHITKNGGGSWENISNTLPQNLWVSRIVASQHKKERVYATLNGYRWDDFSVYVYQSDNYGETWRNISSNIPHSPVNVIREDPKNESVLYLGTDNGAYVTFNNGDRWEAFSKGLPSVAVHDMVIQPETGDLLLGTHGRSIYKTNIKPFQDMHVAKIKQSLVLFDVDNIKHSSRWGSGFTVWSEVVEPSININFYVKKSGEQTIAILSENNLEVHQIKVKADKGFNTVAYDLSISEAVKTSLNESRNGKKITKSDNGRYYLPKGEYTIQIGMQTTQFKID